MDSGYDKPSPYNLATGACLSLRVNRLRITGILPPHNFTLLGNVCVLYAHSVYTLQVHGEVWHRAGSLLPEQAEWLQYAQMWMYDGDDLLDAQ